MSFTAYKMSLLASHVHTIIVLV